MKSFRQALKESIEQYKEIQRNRDSSATQKTMTYFASTFGYTYEENRAKILNNLETALSDAENSEYDDALLEACRTNRDNIQYNTTPESSTLYTLLNNILIAVRTGTLVANFELIASREKIQKLEKIIAAKKESALNQAYCKKILAQPMNYKNALAKGMIEEAQKMFREAKNTLNSPTASPDEEDLENGLNEIGTYNKKIKPITTMAEIGTKEYLRKKKEQASALIKVFENEENVLIILSYIIPKINKIFDFGLVDCNEYYSYGKIFTKDAIMNVTETRREMNEEGTETIAVTMLNYIIRTHKEKRFLADTRTRQNLRNTMKYKGIKIFQENKWVYYYASKKELLNSAEVRFTENDVIYGDTNYTIIDDATLTSHFSMEIAKKILEDAKNDFLESKKSAMPNEKKSMQFCSELKSLIEESNVLNKGECYMSYEEKSDFISKMLSQLFTGKLFFIKKDSKNVMSFQYETPKYNNRNRLFDNPRTQETPNVKSILNYLHEIGETLNRKNQACTLTQCEAQLFNNTAKANNSDSKNQITPLTG